MVLSSVIQGHCFVFLGKTSDSNSDPLQCQGVLVILETGLTKEAGHEIYLVFTQLVD